MQFNSLSDTSGCLHTGVADFGFTISSEISVSSQQFFSKHICDGIHEHSASFRLYHYFQYIGGEKDYVRFVKYVWFKNDLDRSTMHVKFNRGSNP